MSLEGKVALVTGAGRGMGRATALALANDGANVAVTDILADAVEETSTDVRAAGRQSVAIADDHLFVSAHHRRIPTPRASTTFHRVVRLAGIAAGRQRRPRLVDLRHTFATRSLQRCAVRRESVAGHLVALSTYLGHTSVVHTYWYLEATPDLMADIATAGENLVAGRPA